MSVLLITSLGNLHFDLYYKDCPLTTKNFLKLCKIKYYNNKLFYRVQKDFIAQSGSPENNDTSSQNKSIYGLLNPQNQKSNFFKSEILPKYQHNQKGLLATANIGPDLNTSTFYITLTSNNLLSLNNKHTIFKMSHIPIKRWKMIKHNYSPYDASKKEYFEERAKNYLI